MQCMCFWLNYKMFAMNYCYFLLSMQRYTPQHASIIALSTSSRNNYTQTKTNHMLILHFGCHAFIIWVRKVLFAYLHSIWSVLFSFRLGFFIFVNNLHLHESHLNLFEFSYVSRFWRAAMQILSNYFNECLAIIDFSIFKFPAIMLLLTYLYISILWLYSHIQCKFASFQIW